MSTQVARRGSRNRRLGVRVPSADDDAVRRPAVPPGRQGPHDRASRSLSGRVRTTARRRPEDAPAAAGRPAASGRCSVAGDERCGSELHPAPGLAASGVAALACTCTDGARPARSTASAATILKATAMGALLHRATGYALSEPSDGRLRVEPRSPALVPGRARHLLSRYSTVTVFARLRGWSTGRPRMRAMRYASSCSGTTARTAERKAGAFGT